MESPKVEPILLKGSSLKADFERLESMDIEVMIFYCNMKTKELQPKYCGTQEMMNVAKNTELGKKFVKEFLACCEEINAQKKKIDNLQKEADKNLVENMTLDMSVEEVVNEAVITQIKEEEFSESAESETTEKEVESMGKANDLMWSQMLTNFVRMVEEYENTQKNEKPHRQADQSGADSMGAKSNDENSPKDEINGVKIKTEPVDPDDEMIPQTNQNVIGIDYSNVNSQIAVSSGSNVSTTVAMTTSNLATVLQSNFLSGSENISNSNAHAVAGTSVSVGGPVGATSTGGVAVMPESTLNSLSLKMIGNKLYFVLPCNMNIPLQPVVSKASVTQSITSPTGNPLVAVQNIGLPELQGNTLAPVQNVPINMRAAANTFVSAHNIAITAPAVNTSVQNVVLSNMGLVASKTGSLQNLVTPNTGLAANTQVPVLNVLPGVTANTSDIGLTPRRILPQALQQTNTGQVPVLGTIEGTSAANSDKTLKSNVVMPTVEPVLQSKQTASRERQMVQTPTGAQRLERMLLPCVEPSAKSQKMDAESSASSQNPNSIQHTLSKNDYNPGLSVKNTVAKDGDIVYNTYMLPSGVYREGMPHIAAITTATSPSLQEGDMAYTSPVPCLSKSSTSLTPSMSLNGGPTSADEQVCDDDDNVDDDENKDDDDEGGAENTTANQELERAVDIQQTSVSQSSKRFKVATEEDILNYQSIRQSRSTKKNTKWGYRIFQVKRDERCVIMLSGFSNEDMKQIEILKRQVAEHEVIFIDEADNSLSHLIVNTVSQDQTICRRTLKYFQAIARKVWVVNRKWLIDSAEAGHLLPEEAYEIQGDNIHGRHYGPRLARTSSSKILQGYKFQLVVTEDDSVLDLVITCGGIVVDEVSYDAPKEIILVLSESNISGLPSNATALSVTWLLDTISTNTLQTYHNYTTHVKDPKNIIMQALQEDGMDKMPVSQEDYNTVQEDDIDKLMPVPQEDLNSPEDHMDKVIYDPQGDHMDNLIHTLQEDLVENLLDSPQEDLADKLLPTLQNKRRGSKRKHLTKHEDEAHGDLDSDDDDADFESFDEDDDDDYVMDDNEDIYSSDDSNSSVDRNMQRNTKIVKNRKTKENDRKTDQTIAPSGEGKDDKVDSVMSGHLLDKGITIQQPSVEGKKIGQKRQCCVFCGQMITTLSRHMERKHSNEEEVAKILLMPKKSKERRHAWESLVAKGNFIHNVEVLKTGKGTLITKYRPRKGEVKETNKYLPCDICLSFFIARDLWKHKRTCRGVCGGKKHVRGARGIRDGKLLLPLSSSSSKGLPKMFYQS